MTVTELREALEKMPGHWPVHVAVRADGSGRVAVPIQQGGSFVVASYVPSGLNTADGVEIWIELEHAPPIH